MIIVLNSLNSVFFVTVLSVKLVVSLSFLTEKVDCFGIARRVGLVWLTHFFFGVKVMIIVAWIAIVKVVVVIVIELVKRAIEVIEVIAAILIEGFV